MLNPEDADIQDDVKESFQRSQDLFVSLEHISSGIIGNNFRVAAKKKLVERQRAVQQIKESLSKASRPKVRKPDSTHSLAPKSRQTSKTPDPKSTHLPRHAGKAMLNYRLHEFNQRLILTKAGKPVTTLPDDRSGSPYIDRVVRTTMTPTGTGPTEDTFLTWQNQSSDIDSSHKSPHALPHVSLTSGKVEPAVKLPTYREYCETHNTDLIKGPTNKKTIKSAEEAIGRLEKLKKHLNGLSILLQVSPETPWNGDKKVLYKLDKYPAQRSTIIKAYSGKIDGHRKSILEPKIRGGGNQRKTEVLSPEKVTRKLAEHRRGGVSFVPSKTPQPNREGKEAYLSMKLCADNFIDSQETQNRKLIDILDRYEIERPFLLKRKSKFIGSDNEQFKDIGHSMQKFTEYRRCTDAARSQRVLRAKNQIQVYEKMLEFLKVQSTQPTESQLLCLEIVKNVLEEGWEVNAEVVGKIKEALGDDMSQDVKNLVKVLEGEVMTSITPECVNS